MHRDSTLAGQVDSVCPGVVLRMSLDCRMIYDRQGLRVLRTYNCYGSLSPCLQLATECYITLTLTLAHDIGQSND